MRDKIAEEILKIINGSNTPLETKEVSERLQQEVGDVSRSKLIYRLNNLRGDGEISGKSVGSGKGVWIWWKAENDK
jgi:repressor of nif and glnA expression